LPADLALRGLPLRTRGITAGYGADPVIRDMTVAVAPGQIVSLVGPNGSGKSTLLKSLVGIVHVASARCWSGTGT
jgi:ABC-type cobalamin/Fe3+-siderophores transport system ATPase subunit